MQLSETWDIASVRIKGALLEHLVNIRDEKVVIEVKNVIALFSNTLQVKSLSCFCHSTLSFFTYLTLDFQNK